MAILVLPEPALMAKATELRRSLVVVPSNGMAVWRVDVDLAFGATD